MNASPPSAAIVHQMRRATVLILTFWTLAIAASVVWNVRLLHDAMFEAATHDARNSFNKDVLYRRWATSHGGVYVPVTDMTPPNPHLTDIFERDLVTPSGRRLTLMNPAYMTRQVHELGLQYGSRGHITSLKPLRPENAPDAWEKVALHAFEQGKTEVISQEMLDDQPELRFMKPLVTEAGCLKCHAVQGYKEGEIRGGISVSVALTPYLEVAHARIWPIAGVHAGLWFLGVLGILLGASQVRQRIDNQFRADEEIKSLSKFPSENPFPIMRLGENGSVLYANEAGEALLKAWSCSIGERVPETWCDTVKEVLASKTSKIIDIDLCGRTFSFAITPVSDLHYVNLYGRDITKRKQAELKLKDAFTEIQHLREAMDHVPAYVYMKDSQFRYIYANRLTLELFGCSAKELVGFDDTRYFPPDTVKRLREVDLRVFAGEQTSEEINVADAGANRRVYWEVKTPIYVEPERKTVWGLLGISTDITQRKQSGEKLKSLLKEKEMLIKEVHHRVKNNFAVVSSLLGLQSRDIHDTEVKAMFMQSRDRINSMALLHERLYQSQDLTHINFSEYLGTLADDLVKAYESDSDRISTVIEVDDIVLDVNKVLPCGLIVNELISNALKYGFPKSRTDKGQIKVSFQKINGNEVELAVMDNGVGLPDDFDIEKSPSLGLQLVTMMAEGQLGGKLKVSGKGGAKFQIQFPLHPLVE
ncbi:DUF3365 domain-containing protein [candidate division KSB1 bacterium]|nr:DUF3365 domain-containing protein [candidate division KSB1 bacterium]